jgi:hypothetical protein
MMSQNTQKNRNRWSLFLKWAIALFALAFIYFQLRNSSRQDWWSAALLAFEEGGHLNYFFSAATLLLVNLSLEAIKWRVALAPVEDVRFSVALRAVFSGLTVSVFTPNRIGEYAGRVFVLQKADRITAILLTVIASFSQLVVTVIAGTIAAFHFSMEQASEWMALPFLVLLPVISLVVILFFIRIKWFKSLLIRIPFPSNWKNYFVAFEMLGLSSLLRILLFAALRYVVFTFQFYLLLCFFGVEISYINALTCIALVYLAMQVVPTITITELGVRGSLAIAFFSVYTDALEEVVFASSLLWLINLILPALIGCLFVFKFNFFRKTAE